MNSRLVSLVLFAACFAAGAVHADDTTGRAKIERDNAAWRPMKLLEKRHQPAPREWHVTGDVASGLKFAAPCELQRSVEQQQGVELSTYLCRGEQLAYAVIVTPTTQASQADWIQSFWIGHDSAMLARLQQRDPAATLTPLARISYQGMAGRQHRIAGQNFAVISRLLPSARAAITMFVAGPPQNLPGDSERFFATIELPASGKND